MSALLTLSTCLCLPVSAAVDWHYTILDHPAPSPPALAGFGSAVQVLDFSGDGVADVAVGAPGESKVYVFLGAFGFQRHVEITAVPFRPGDGFGYDLDAAPLDGVPGDELIVGAPQRKVSGFNNAGAVFVVGRSYLSSPQQFSAASPQPGAALGNSLAVADFDGDGVPEIAAGAPTSIIPDGHGGYVRAGSVALFELDGSTLVRFVNHQPRPDANYGHDVAALDYDEDGHVDLAISAPGNASAAGALGAGQVALQLGSFDWSGASRVLYQDGPDPSGEAPPINQRFGMSVSGGDGLLLVGSPRRDLQGRTIDAGAGYIFEPGHPTVVLTPAPVEKGLMGYRTHTADLIGDGAEDVLFVALNAKERAGGVWIWDPGDRARPPLRIPPPPRFSSHWAQGLDAGQVFAGGKDEVVIGDSEWEPAGLPKGYDSGRVAILELE